MKKIRLFFYGALFLAVLSGLCRARTVFSHAALTTLPPIAIAAQAPQTPEDLPPPSIRFESGSFTIASFPPSIENRKT